MKTSLKFDMTIKAVPDENCNPKVVGEIHMDWSHEMGIGEITEVAAQHGTKVKSTIEQFMAAQNTLRNEVQEWRRMLSEPVPSPFKQ